MSDAYLTRRRFARVLWGLAALFVVAVLIAVNVGAVRVDLAHALSGGADNVDALILWRTRLPRVLLGALVGAGLALSGAVLQALLRNPLAEPHLLGVSGGAALGGVLTLFIATGAAWHAYVLAPLGAFAGALAATALVYRLGLVRGHLEPYTFLLAGVVCNAFTGALIMAVNAFAGFFQVHGILFWLMGSLATQSYALVAASACYLAVGAFLLLREARVFNALSLGEEGAALLGVDVTRSRRLAFVVSSLLVGASVAVSGMIGFVGLIVPHVARLLIGSDHRLLLPASALLGASFLVAADTVARSAAGGSEIPIGVVTALAGGPFFIYLLRKEGIVSAADTSIAVQGVTFGYGRKAVIEDVSFAVPSGGFFGIIGPNGSGKSTLLRLLSGFLKPWRGEIAIGGRAIGRIRRRELGQLIAVVPQETAVSFPYTVMEMVLLGRTPHLRGFAFESGDDLRIANEAMARTNVAHLAERVFSDLSGGERQRVVLARALAQRPALLLLDEPSAFLDIRHEVEIYDLLRDLHEGGITVVIVLHDLNLAALYCEKLLLVCDGRVRCCGSVDEVMTYANLTAAYGTEIYVSLNDITGTLNVLPIDGRHRARLRARDAEKDEQEQWADPDGDQPG